jgi:hypothetical protein
MSSIDCMVALSLASRAGKGRVGQKSCDASVQSTCLVSEFGALESACSKAGGVAEQKSPGKPRESGGGQRLAMKDPCPLACYGDMSAVL